MLIQALLYLREKVQDVQVIFGGDGTDLSRLKTLAEETGVSDIVHIPGTIISIYHQNVNKNK